MLYLKFFWNLWTDITRSDEHSLNEERRHERFENKLDDDTEEEPRKITPKIKAHLHVDVYHCKCGTPNCSLSPSW